MESSYHLSSLFIIGKRCSPGYVLDEGSTTCVGVTSKLYSVGNQASGNTACGAFKDGSGTLVSGSVLCGNGYRGTIQVLLFFFSKVFVNVIYSFELSNSDICYKILCNFLDCIRSK